MKAGHYDLLTSLQGLKREGMKENTNAHFSRTQLPSRKTARLMSRTTVDLEADKAQKEKIEQNMIELRRDMRGM